ncbi:MAG: uracil-DNA glycosylase, partial [Planctomycetales bacterium]|nr:uracil-DNA glycosylase [Planctomycetales bacterium]NIN08262.1 uracil-DNA glycosylase [Planctomycetales bacterium]NIN77387.1 uracil-DNA glycosylase [Planctomycetales bacterium]NIP04440.1 uracil-DNA glycosylase [Planctomycetales bacterium]
PQVFSALERTQPDRVKVIILGQDPYPTPGHAHGLSFSVEPEVRPLPRSLNNIFKELAEDLNLYPTNGDLRPWADQGVLLFNSALTVTAGEAGAHAKLGWSELVEQVLRRLDTRPRACLLWGKHAQKLGGHLHNPDHLRIETAHPSPLSARRGFFGSRPFSRVNDWLIARGETPIDWTGTS